MSSLNVSIEQAKRSTQDKSCFAALVAKFLPVQLHGNRFTTLGARDFSSAVSGFGTAEDGWPSANTENSRRTREKPLVPRVQVYRLGGF